MDIENLKTLQTERLQMQPLILAHAADIFATINAYREELRTWLPFVDFTRKIEDTEAYIKYTSDIVFAIYKNNDFVGLIGLNDYDKSSRKAEIGYWISPPMQCKGYATEACQKLVKFAFDEMGINILQIKVAVKNLQSARVAQKIGFVAKGIERNGELLLSGYTDLQIFSLSHKETLD